MFIHDALNEYVTSGDTETAVANLRIALGKLYQNDSAGFKRQYKVRHNRCMATQILVYSVRSRIACLYIPSCSQKCLGNQTKEISKLQTVKFTNIRTGSQKKYHVRNIDEDKMNKNSYKDLLIISQTEIMDSS